MKDSIPGQDGRTGAGFTILATKEALFFLGAALPLIVGLLFYLSASRIPGDLGDARFNMYILEHGYRWMAGLDRSFWSAPFFFPAVNVVAYSDNLLGSMPVYAFFRELGKDRESSYQWWIAVSFILNYLSSFWVLRKWTLSLLGSAAGAYLFTFGLPVMSQAEMHLQLIPRFMVPVGFYFWMRFLLEPSPKFFALSLGALLWQIYIGIYTGYFLGLFMAATWAFHWISEYFRLESWSLRSIKIAFWDVLLRAWKSIVSLILRPFIAYWIIVGLFLLGMLPLAVPYANAARSVGTRSWGEISSMLPRIQSYFHDPESLLYGREMTFGHNLPLPWEHMLFLGWVPILALVAFAVFLRFCTEELNLRHYRILFGSIVIIYVLTLDIGSYSIYWVVAHLPGASAIRSITRMIVVMLFPIAAILGYLVTKGGNFFKRRSFRRGSSFLRISGMILVAAIVLFLVVDQSSQLHSFDKERSQARIIQMEKKIRLVLEKEGGSGSDLKKIVIWVDRGKSSSFEIQIDAMLASQDLGIETVNGYSGNFPPGYGSVLSDLGVGKCGAFQHWIDSHKKDFEGRRILIVGATCP